MHKSQLHIPQETAPFHTMACSIVTAYFTMTTGPATVSGSYVKEYNSIKNPQVCAEKCLDKDDCATFGFCPPSKKCVLIGELTYEPEPEPDENQDYSFSKDCNIYKSKYIVRYNIMLHCTSITIL